MDLETIYKKLMEITEKIDQGNKVFSTTGQPRKIDELGRITIPKNIRLELDILDGTDATVAVQDSNTIIIKINK
jgi:hypothetical protein